MSMQAFDIIFLALFFFIIILFWIYNRWPVILLLLTNFFPRWFGVPGDNPGDVPGDNPRDVPRDNPRDVPRDIPMDLLRSSGVRFPIRDEPDILHFE